MGPIDSGGTHPTRKTGPRPTLGRWITGQPDAYEYLPESTLGFKTAEELATLMRDAGLLEAHGLEAPCAEILAVT